MTDDSRDETQRMPPPAPDGDPTQLMDGGDGEGEPTRLMPARDEATHRMSTPPTSDDAATRRLDVRTAAGAGPEATRRLRRRTVTTTPPTERIVVPDARRGLASGVIALIVVVALVVGGLVGYREHEPSDGNVVSRALVGPGGGVMTFDRVGKLTIPTGALPSPTAITIRRDTIGQRVRLGAEGDPGTVTYEPGELVVYAFEPADLRFQQPVVVELPRTRDGSTIFVDARGAPRVVQGDVKGQVVKISTTAFTFEDARA